MIGEAVVATARGWIGTPFEGQQSCKGAGCDCKGLIVGVARELGLPEASSRWAKMADYQFADSALLLEGLAETMDRVERDDLQPGDLLLIKIGKPAKPAHMAIYCGDNRMIHTLFAGPSRVREVPIWSELWPQVHSIWRWRDSPCR